MAQLMTTRTQITMQIKLTLESRPVQPRVLWCSGFGVGESNVVAAFWVKEAWFYTKHVARHFTSRHSVLSIFDGVGNSKCLLYAQLGACLSHVVARGQF